MSSSSRITQLGDEIRSIAEKTTLTADDAGRLEALGAEFEKELAADRLARDGFDSDPIGEPGSIQRKRYKDPWALARDGSLEARNTSPKEWKARALSAIEGSQGASDRARETATKVLETDDDAHGSLSRLALLTSDPHYVSAFGEMARTSGANPILSEEEVQAIRRVKSEARAMGLTDNAGGFLIPFQLDPAVINTSDGSYNPVRAVAKQVQATGDTYNPVSAGETSWSWDAEAEEVSDDTSTFAQPSITIHKAQGFVPISMEAFEDAANVAQEVGMLLSAGRSTIEAVAFATGSGTGEPFGIITALNTTGQVVGATTDNQFGSVDVYAVDEALAARYRQSGSAAWFAHRAIQHDIRQFESTSGNLLFPDVTGGVDSPGRLLGNPSYEMEGMDGTIGTGDDYVLVFGDFSHYYIADRSSSVEFVPHLLAPATAVPPVREDGLPPTAWVPIR
jgi:HK97 family phage major capsid protein